MITFEEILPTLNELFIEKLPIYIEEINKEHNDGIILQPFQNKHLLENCQKLPCFHFELQEAEYTEKDRIVENTVFNFSLEINTKSSNELEIIEICRYAEAIDNLINENNKSFLDFRITKIKDNKILFRVLV